MRKRIHANAALHGPNGATVLQKLIVEGKITESALLFSMRIKRENATGITIEDCGRKMGLNGVGTGRLNSKRNSAFGNLLDPTMITERKIASPISSDIKDLHMSELWWWTIGIPRQDK